MAQELDLKVAERRFGEFVGVNRDVRIHKSFDSFKIEDTARLSYIAPSEKDFNDRVTTILGKFGWKLESEDISNETKRIELKFTR